MPYDPNCCNCPYYNQMHLAAPQRTARLAPPVELVDNSSSILLVFQAPGIEEWASGHPIEPTIKTGGTGGSRIASSWRRSGKSRNDFDIIDLVQCFPGKTGSRDQAPCKEAINCCSSRLLQVLQMKNYRKIVAFGKLAHLTLSSLINEHSIQSELVEATHPNGGATNSELDGLWS